jgi:hypothetical protein
MAASLHGELPLLKPVIVVGFVRGCVPVVHEMLRHDDFDVVAAYADQQEELAAANIPTRALREKLTPEREARITAAYNARADAVRETLADTSEDLRACVEHALAHDVLQTMLLIELLRVWVEEEDVRLVFVPHDYPRDTKALVMAARRWGVPSFHVLHGYTYGTWNMMGEMYADRTAVFSEACKQLYLEVGVPEERMVVTGNPSWDAAMRVRTWLYGKTAQNVLGVDLDKPVVLFAHTYTHRLSNVSSRYPQYANEILGEIMQAFAELSAKHPDWQFILRPHPNDVLTEHTLREDSERMGIRNVFVDRDLHVLMSLAIADVVLCIQSNVGIEAILTGKPVINVMLDANGKEVFDEGWGRLFNERDAVLDVREAATLVPAIESVMCDDAVRAEILSRRDYSIEHFCDRPDGKASRRAAQVALSMMGYAPDRREAAERHPEFEPMLAGAVPDTAKQVLVVGRAAGYVADVIEARVPKATVVTAANSEEKSDRFDCVVFSDPLPHTGEAEALLRVAAAKSSSCVVAAFRNGGVYEARAAHAAAVWTPPIGPCEASIALGEFSQAGVDVVLSRGGLSAEDLLVVTGDPVPDVCVAAVPDPGEVATLSTVGWMVRAVPKESGPGAWGMVFRERAGKAEEAHARGEAFATVGNWTEAVAAFNAAVELWDGEVRYWVDLGRALLKAELPDRAWGVFVNALLESPGDVGARDGLRDAAHVLERELDAERILGRYLAPAE